MNFYGILEPLHGVRVFAEGGCWRRMDLDENKII